MKYSYVYLCFLIIIKTCIYSYQFHTFRQVSVSSTSSLFKLSNDNNVDDSPSEIINNDNQIAMAKLKAEVVTPFRLLRFFIYGGIGSAGGLGSFTAIPQLIIALQNKDADLSNAVTNVLVDVGGVITAIVLWIKENESQQKLLNTFTSKQMKLDNKISPTAVQEREKQLSMLPVEIQISENNENITRIVSLNDLQLKGKQNVIIVAGTYDYVRDCIISARIEGQELFINKETIIIPYIRNDQQLDESKEKGFGKKETLMTAPYIAKPKQLTIWETILQNEVNQAELQGMKDLWEQGFLIALNKKGQVDRRGLGQPPWKDVVEQLNKKI